MDKDLSIIKGIFNEYNNRNGKELHDTEKASDDLEKYIKNIGLPKSQEEELHELIQGGDFEASSADFMANFAGFGCINSPEGCECCCNMQHGVSYE